MNENEEKIYAKNDCKKNMSNIRKIRKKSENEA